VFAAAEGDPGLDQRLCQQRKLGELVRHAYEDLPRPRRMRDNGRRRGPLGGALAASVLILLGLAGGLLTHRQLDQRAAAPVAAEGNYILHVTSGDSANMQAALREARQLVDSGTASAPRRVEVVANEEGLNLLRSDITPFAEEIAVLAQHEVVFYACARAIQRLEERGVEVHLVPQADSRFTALDRVVMRMQDGWNYRRL